MHLTLQSLCLACCKSRIKQYHEKGQKSQNDLCVCVRARTSEDY